MRKNTEAHKDLEWFGPPERNTLRPLCDVLPELVCKLGEELCLLCMCENLWNLVSVVSV